MELNSSDIRIRIGALGGLDESGKSCFIIEVDNDIFVIEAGLKYPDSFTPGIDYLIPNFDYLIENKDRVKAVIITHGHDDIYGALPYLLEVINVPCYLTSNTLTLLKSDYGAKFDFSKYTFKIVSPSDEINIANHRFSLFSTTHSASDSFGFVLRTDLGNIIYTGDFITDYNGLSHYSFDFAKVASIANERNALILLSESNGADKIGICAPKHKLTPHIRREIEEQTKRLFIGIYSQNFYNIQEVINLAQENNKRIVIVNDRFAAALNEINQNGTLIIPKNNYATANEMMRYSSKDLIVLILGSGEELFDLISDLAHGEYQDQGISINENDKIILACPSVPGTEVKATESLDSVYQTGAEVVNLTHKDISSMHAQEEDLKMMISLFRPKYYMPIKGEYRLLMANAKIALSTGLGYNYANVVVLDNGMLLNIDKSGKLLQNITRVKEGTLLVAGHSVGEAKAHILQERQRLADDGILCLSVAVSSKQQRIVSQPEVQMRGFIYLGDQKNIYQEINSIFNEELHTLMTKKMMSTSEAEKRLVDRLSKYLVKQAKKNPYIDVNIINIDESVK
ncbi:MAG TPA: hypothetical protein DCY93_00850 [Firmicutes bacterium]|nr:hypothetical protein [Bacillota bacterium]